MNFIKTNYHISRLGSAHVTSHLLAQLQIVSPVWTSIGMIELLQFCTAVELIERTEYSIWLPACSVTCLDIELQDCTIVQVLHCRSLYEIFYWFGKTNFIPLVLSPI